jgi:ubiquinone/menaquinone biosynthesis C-methylase UbiE
MFANLMTRLRPESAQPQPAPPPHDGRYHFVGNYERWVNELIATSPLDEAVSIAVGGAYEQTGRIECDLLVWAGMKDGMSMIDFGCGCGRLASQLHRRVNVDYLGIDIIQPLLDYAARKSPPHYRFIQHRGLSIPAPDASADILAAFSVFTHMLHSETYIYLEDIRRVLKPSGKLVFSFLEFADPGHWVHFAGEVESRRADGATPFMLNQTIERDAIRLWAKKLGYTVERFVDGGAAPWGSSPLGQALVILTR